MSGMEIVVAGIAGTIGISGFGLLNRFLVTRKDAPLADKGYMTEAPIYKDFVRLGASAVLAAAPLIGAHFIRSPMGRAGLQGFGLGALFGLGGKLIEDVSAMLLADNTYGKQLFPNEIAAQAAEKAAAGTAGIPKGKDEPKGLGAAIDAVKEHMPALKALAAAKPALEAVGLGRATPEQSAHVEAVLKLHGKSIEALKKFDEKDLKVAAERAGLAGPPPAPPAPPAPPRADAPAAPPRPAMTPSSPNAPRALSRSPLDWANNGQA